MLESRENRELCRNGLPRYYLKRGESDTALNKSLEQELLISYAIPLLLENLEQGFLMNAETQVNYQADPRLYDSGIVPVINIAEQPRDQFTRYQAARFVAQVLRPEFRSNLVEMDNPQSIHSLKD